MMRLEKKEYDNIKKAHNGMFFVFFSTGLLLLLTTTTTTTENQITQNIEIKV
jgi:hypothetical protein